VRHLLAQMLLVCNLCLIPVSGSAVRRKPRVMRMRASAFSQASSLTAAGTVAHSGIVAADPAILPLGSRIRITGAGVYNGVYTVTDTGGKIIGHRIDLYVHSAARARQFGKKMVRVQVLETGKGRQDARDKEIYALRPAKPK
jgi:rare lipoprotein A